MVYISSACLKNERVGTTIEILAQNGIKNIELSGGSSYYRELGADLMDLKVKHGLTYACHAYFPPPEKPFVVNLASCNDKIYKQSIAHYEKCIDMLKNLKCNVLSLHAGFLVEVGVDEIGKKLSMVKIYQEDEAYERFCTAYSYIANLCKKNGIEIYLENNVLNAENYREFHYCNYMMMTDFKTIMKMKSQLEFHLLLDLGHLYVSSHTLHLDYFEECRLLKDYTRWIHISENDGSADQHRPLDENGEIIGAFIQLYKEDRNVTLETVGDIHAIKNSAAMVERALHDEN